MTQQVSETLNPSNAALLLIDHQVGTMNFGISDLSALELKNQTLLLAEAARAFGLPVVLTASNPNGPNGPIFPELLWLATPIRMICGQGIDRRKLRRPGGRQLRGGGHAPKRAKARSYSSRPSMSREDASTGAASPEMKFLATSRRARGRAGPSTCHVRALSRAVRDLLGVRSRSDLLRGSLPRSGSAFRRT